MGNFLSSWMPSSGADLRAVDNFDLSRYARTWYQVGFLPNWFQNKDSRDVKAIYTQLDADSMHVRNESRVDGEFRYIEGMASKDPECCRGEARFLVRFKPNVTQPIVGPAAPYWVIQLAGDYRYAVVSEPTRRFLWILSAVPTIDERDLADIVQKLVLDQGFTRQQISALVWTPHSDAERFAQNVVVVPPVAANVGACVDSTRWRST